MIIDLLLWSYNYKSYHHSPMTIRNLCTMDLWLCINSLNYYLLLQSIVVFLEFVPSSCVALLSTKYHKSILILLPISKIKNTRPCCNQSTSTTGLTKKKNNNQHYAFIIFSCYLVVLSCIILYNCTSWLKLATCKNYDSILLLCISCYLLV